VGTSCSLFILSATAIAHVVGEQPQPVDGPAALAGAGGLLGWIAADWITTAATAWTSIPLFIVLILLAALIVTKTPPTLIVQRVRDVWSHLFPQHEPRVGQSSTGSVPHVSSHSDLGDGRPWWTIRKNKDKPFDTPVESEKSATGIIADMFQAEEAARQFASESNAPASGDDAPTEVLDPAPTEPVVDDVVLPDTPWITIVWNDPINLMSYVTLVFQKVFGYSVEKATALMLDVHQKGRAVVSSGAREKAEIDVFRLHEHGLWATMQQDD
jgi:ATP-dependent Clp protease adapter protein ClpS